MSRQPFEVQFPLPPRRSAEALRDQLVDYLLRSSPQVGERFMSDHELVRASKLSRPTVRRALDDLHRDGWIERRHGRGTFIGPRAGMPISARMLGGAGRGETPRTLVRLALVMHILGDISHDWYTREVLRGIDQAAEETGVAIELLGDHDGDIASLSRRLQQTKPDVVAFTAPPLARTMLIGEARRVGVPCIGTGTLLALLGVPTICEDGFEAAVEGVKYLVERGHRRIGFVQITYPLPWAFQRYEGFLAGMERAGLGADQSMTVWLNADLGHDQERLEKFVRERQPTALVFGCANAVSHLGPLVRSGRLKVPGDVSVVTFDQNAKTTEWAGAGVEVTTIGLPLVAMGKRLAGMARAVAEGKEVEKVVKLPCEMVEGGSV